MDRRARRSERAASKTINYDARKRRFFSRIFQINDGLKYLINFFIVKKNLYHSL